VLRELDVMLVQGSSFPAIAMETDYHAHLGREKLYLSSGEANANMFVPTVDELFDMKRLKAMLVLRFFN
jgi:hypothetical protein